MDKQQVRRGRLQFMLIAALFLGPLVVAMVLYYSDLDWRPSGYSNHGALLLPVVNVVEPLENDESAQALQGSWSLLYISSDDCVADSDCRAQLYALRQIRLMLGKNMDRLQRVLLHAGPSIDPGYLASEQGGLVLLRNAHLRSMLQSAYPAGNAANGYFLLDPLGNLVMYFPPDLNPRDIVSDIKHLLSLSHIG